MQVNAGFHRQKDAAGLTCLDLRLIIIHNLKKQQNKHI